MGTRIPNIVFAVQVLGSSPRVWGQVIFRHYFLHFGRIIPTRMGTSNTPFLRNLYDGDHPHAYGDKLALTGCLVALRGSSPRVWGQDIKNIRCSQIIRIIPTRMGTSNKWCVELHRKKDHPHAYGDKAPTITALSAQMGSSPRVWGQDSNPSEKHTLTRIIPTRMGTRF